MAEDADKVADWFSGSCVRAQDRTPLVLWHATPHQFDRFEVGASKDIGIHFGTRRQAERRERTSRPSRIHRHIPVLLRIANPLILHDDPEPWSAHRMANLIEHLVDQSFRRANSLLQGRDSGLR